MSLFLFKMRNWSCRQCVPFEGGAGSQSWLLSAEPSPQPPPQHHFLKVLSPHDTQSLSSCVWQKSILANESHPYPILLPIFFMLLWCMCVQGVCVCARTSIHTPTLIYGRGHVQRPEDKPWCCLQKYIQGLSLVQSSPIRQGCLASEAPLHSCLYFPSSGIMRVCHHIWHFHTDSGN